MKPNIAQRRRARSLLVQALYQWEMAASDMAELEAQFRADQEGKIDWAYFHEVLVEIPGCVGELDELMAGSLDRKVSELTPVERAILRLGLFELSRRIDVPFRVVINEYVDLAKKFGATESHKYVNGVLDKAARGLRISEQNRRS